MNGIEKFTHIYPLTKTDSSCNHNYYAHHGFDRVAAFKSDEWKTYADEYLTYIFKKDIE